MKSSGRSVDELERELRELQAAYDSLQKLYEHESEELQREIEQKSIVDSELTILHAAVKQSPFMMIITDL